MGATLYLGGRLLFVPLYVAGIPLVRSMVWNVATMGILLILAGIWVV